MRLWRVTKISVRAGSSSNFHELPPVTYRALIYAWSDFARRDAVVVSCALRTPCRPTAGRANGDRRWVALSWKIGVSLQSTHQSVPRDSDGFWWRLFGFFQIHALRIWTFRFGVFLHIHNVAYTKLRKNSLSPCPLFYYGMFHCVWLRKNVEILPILLSSIYWCIYSYAH